jgi:arylsulfatase A-like enzyme
LEGYRNPLHDPAPPKTSSWIMALTDDSPPVRNVLFVMCDQLRTDHLSCYGHPVLHTPNIDAIAARGVRFDSAFVQSAVCGPSRMSFYTGRYVPSHGTTWNHVPLALSQVTLGEMLRHSGRSVTLAGKTHVIPDRDGARRVGLDPDSQMGQLFLAGGFDQLDRYDGHAPPGSESGYSDYLRSKGYDGRDPWSDWVIAAKDETGEKVSGWLLRNAHLPSLVEERHSETAYMTDKAIDFVREQGDKPWVLHLSYVKPHWPLLAPAPYHDMYRGYRTEPSRHPRELVNAHPVLAAYRQSHEDCRSYADAEVVHHVRPTYMGFIKQVDDHIGRLMGVLGQLGRLDDTLIVFTSDHGDHFGDHYMGEKEVFYESAVRVPMIVSDPRPGADTTRGTVDKSMVEAVDVVPTVLEALGVEVPSHLVEGRSMLPLLNGSTPSVERDAVFSMLDYSYRDARRALGRQPGECNAWMVRTREWKYVHWQGFRPQLFDLVNDPQEFEDLGADRGHELVRAQMLERLIGHHERLKPRTTHTQAQVERGTEDWRRNGLQIGVW